MLRLTFGGFNRQLPSSQRLFQRLFTAAAIHADTPLYGIHGLVNGAAVYAAPASETRLNLMSAGFARECGIDVRPFRYACSLAHGKKIESVGRGTAMWQFQGEFMRRSVEFLILPETSRPVILGSGFLACTHTLTTNWHRIRKQTVPASGVHCLHLLDCPPGAVAGTVRGEPVLAVPGTGCEINIISDAYVQRRGLEKRVHREEWDRPWVRLANGSLVKTQGRISLSWRFGDEGVMSSWALDFWVLENCDYDVILGQDVLFGSNAFLAYEDCFKNRKPTSRFNDPLEAGVSPLPALMLAFRRKVNVRQAAKLSGDSSIVAELNRRAKFDHDNLKRPPGARSAAWAAEQDRRAQWNLGKGDDPCCGGEGSLAQVDTADTDTSHNPGEANQPAMVPTGCNKVDSTGSQWDNFSVDDGN